MTKPDSPYSSICIADSRSADQLSFGTAPVQWPNAQSDQWTQIREYVERGAGGAPTKAIRLVPSRSTQRRLNEITQQLNDLTLRIEKISKEIKDMRQDMANAPTSVTVWLHEIAPGLELASPLPVTIEEAAGEVVASLPEVAQFGSGTTRTEAIWALKESLSTLYRDLSTSDPATLGSIPFGWLRLLQRLIVQRGNE